MIRRLRAAAAGDDGSILPLTIGFAVLALALVLVCANATSLHLAQKRLDALADAAALAGADGFTLVVDPDGARAQLTDAQVWEEADALVTQVGDGAVLVAATTPDGRSARATVAGTWHPVVVGLFVPDGVTLAATGTSRTALR